MTHASITVNSLGIYKKHKEKQENVTTALLEASVFNQSTIKYKAGILGVLLVPWGLACCGDHNKRTNLSIQRGKKSS